MENLKLMALMQNFQTLLNIHDWTFEMSDMHSAWELGNAQQKAIASLARLIMREGGSRAELETLVAEKAPTLPGRSAPSIKAYVPAD